ncbi:hypothetical protein M0R04_02340 [Candidatus Dojkabacteria bacterium]|jgi:hypothetical protein|nr:hypothetical protein [Candidatus Dojkabacteria bacterium]
MTIRTYSPSPEVNLSPEEYFETVFEGLELFTGASNKEKVFDELTRAKMKLLTGYDCHLTNALGEEGEQKQLNSILRVYTELMNLLMAEDSVQNSCEYKDLKEGLDTNFEIFLAEGVLVIFPENNITYPDRFRMALSMVYGNGMDNQDPLITCHLVELVNGDKQSSLKPAETLGLAVLSGSIHSGNNWLNGMNVRSSTSIQ